MSTATAQKIGLRASGRRHLLFGMVNIGISIAPTLDDKARISGRKVDPETLTPAKQQYVNDAGDVVKPVTAYEAPDGTFVTLDTAEMESIKVDSNDAIDLIAAVPTVSVPREWIDKTYLAWPSDDTHNAAFALMADYLRRNDRALIGRTVERNTTKVLAIRWSEVYNTVVAHVLSYHGQARWANAEIVAEGVAALAAPTPQLADMADALFATMPDTFDWADVSDTYGAALEAAVSAKAATGSVPSLPVPTAAPAADNLMAALAASLAAKGA